MKPQTVRLTGKRQVDYAHKLINECLDQEQLWVVDIKKDKELKTMQQLRGLFGTWYDYLCDALAEIKDDLHHEHKTGYRQDGITNAEYGGWLCDIYYTEPQNPLQQMWCELMDYAINDYKQMPSEKTRGYMAHVASNVSLKWATVDQMREYMTRIEHYYMNAGYPLPILEKYRRVYR